MKINNLKMDSDYSVLRQWCITIFDYLLSIDPRFSDFIYGEYGMMEVIKNIDKTHNLRKMKALYKEMNIFVGEDMLSPKQMDELNQLLKEKFTLTEMQKVYEIIMGKQLDKRNFRKKVLGTEGLIELDEFTKASSKRPARLYQYKQLYTGDLKSFFIANKEEK